MLLSPRFRGAAALAIVLCLAGGALALACSNSGGGGGTSQLCQNFSAYLQACPPNNNTACATAFVNECPQIVSNYSNATIAAENQCLVPPYNCDAGAALGQCLVSKVYTATPTAAQQKVKTDFCASCPDGKSTLSPTSCTNFFPSGAPDAQAQFTPGLIVLEYSDAIAAQIDQSCTGAQPDAGDCATAFLFCSISIIEQSVLPAACRVDGG